VAWNVALDEKREIRDTYTCRGVVSVVKGCSFEWSITEIESDDGARYPQTVIVLDLRKLIEQTFGLRIESR
jgi:hypothetical protein